MAQAITRLFDNYDAATAAVASLEAAGVPHHDISILGSDAEGRHARRAGDGVNESEAAEGAGKGATTGGIIGGASGLLAGLGMLAIPGLGPVVAAGWLVSTAVGAAIGAAAGGAAGGILGALKDAGHTDEEANVYAEGVRRGGTLVSVKTNSETHAATAREVLNGQGGVDAVTRGAEYRTLGWQTFDSTADPYRAEPVTSERGSLQESRSFGGSAADAGVSGHALAGERTRETFSDPTGRPADLRRDI